MNILFLTQVGSLAFQTEIGSLRDEATELEVRLKQFFVGIGENIGTVFPYWRYLPERTPTRFSKYVANARRILELVGPLVAERRRLLEAGAEPTCVVDMFLAEETGHGDVEICWHAIHRVHRLHRFER